MNIVDHVFVTPVEADDTPLQLFNDMLQNCWLSDKITVILWSQNSSENNLFLLNRLPVPPKWRKGTSTFFSNLLQKFTCSYLTLRISSVTLQKYQLSFSIKSMLNRESLFFTELPLIWIGSLKEIETRVFFVQNGFEIYTDVRVLLYS